MKNLLKNRLLASVACLFMGVAALATLPAIAQEEKIPPRSIQNDETAAGFDLQALIEAAKGEPPITIYSQTGKVVGEAERFSAKYGIQATGIKVELGGIEKAAREADAGNIIGDVLINEDLGAIALELIADGKFFNCVPGDIADNIAPEFQYPLQLHFGHMGWVYNNETYATCPVDNLWQLTESEFRNQVAIADPLSNSKYPAWFNMMARNDDAALRALYQERYGEALQTDEPTAAHEWVKRFAANSPKIARTDEEVSEAVGAPGQEKPAFGPTSMAKFRNIAGKGYKMALCETLRPWTLQAFPSGIAIASGSDSINTAKLFVHYLMSEEGFAEELGDGKVSSNQAMALPQDPSHVADFLDKASPYRPSDIVSNFETRMEWDDFWRLHYR